MNAPTNARMKPEPLSDKFEVADDRIEPVSLKTKTGRVVTPSENDQTATKEKETPQ